MKNMAYELIDGLKPLKKEKNPNVACVVGFFFGAIGLGIYFGSFVDFVISMVIGLITFAVAGSAMEEMGLISGALIAAAYGYFRTESSNAKLADSSVAIVREQTYTAIR